MEPINKLDNEDYDTIESSLTESIEFAAAEGDQTLVNKFVQVRRKIFNIRHDK
jgi:hypothetical protein